MELTKLLHKRKQIDLPYLLWSGWCIGNDGLLSPWDDCYTPGQIRLLEWKASFYDREMILYLPTPPTE